MTLQSNDIIDSDTKYLASKIGAKGIEGMKILVTGASGLIGSNLMRFFDTVLKLNLAKIELVAISKTVNVNSVNWHKSIVFREIDLTKADEVSLLDRFDLIFHGATYGQPSKFLSNSRDTLLLNSEAVFNLMSKVSQGGTFVFFSTSEVYSGSTSVPHREEDIGNLTPESERSSYYFGKLFGETATLKCADGIKSKIVRISLCYGPGTRIDDGRVLNQLIRSAFLNNEISLLDKGNAMRTYCYSRDLIEMMLQVVFYGRESIYNIAGNSRTSILQLAENIGKILKVGVNLPRSDHGSITSPNDVQVSLERYAREFSLPDFIPLEEGLRRTIEWQRKNLYLGNKS